MHSVSTRKQGNGKTLEYTPPNGSHFTVHRVHYLLSLLCRLSNPSGAGSAL